MKVQTGGVGHFRHVQHEDLGPDELTFIGQEPQEVTEEQFKALQRLCPGEFIESPPEPEPAAEVQAEDLQSSLDFTDDGFSADDDASGTPEGVEDKPEGDETPGKSSKAARKRP